MFDFNSCKHVKFWPYVGKDYATAAHKILVLGESHYGRQELDEYHEWTQEVVQSEFLATWDARGRGHRWTRCFTNTANVLSPKRGANPHGVFDQIAFYNFLQKSVGNTSRDHSRLTNKMKEDSAKALDEVLRLLKPDLVVGWGWSMEWNYLPKHCNETVLEARCGYGRLRLFNLEGCPPVPFWCMCHPSSSRFNTEAHRACFAEIKNHLNW